MTAPLTGPDGSAATTTSGSTARTAPPARRRLLRGLAAVVAAAAALVGSWFLLRSGIHVDTFPPLLAAAGPASVTRYSGPWITAAAAAALAAGLLLLLGAVDLVRYRRSTRPSV